MAIDDERLMAYADGELHPDEAAEIERMMAENETLAERVAVLADARKMIKRALDPAPHVPVSLAAKIRAMADADAVARQAPATAAQVINLDARRRTVPLWQLPIAASVALALGVLGGWLGKPDTGDARGLAVAVIGDAALTDALSTAKSGETAEIGAGVTVSVIASFRDGDGHLCREFEEDRSGGASVVAVACRADDAWSVRFAIAAASGDDASYSPASSLETLDAWLSSIEAGAPLSDAEEAAALAALQ